MDLESVVLSVLAAVLSAGILYFLYVAARFKKRALLQLEAQLGTELYNQLRSIVAAAVRAAEQSGLADYIEDTADAKLDYALEAAQRQIKLMLGFDLDLKILRDLVEAAVREGVHKRPSEMEPYLAVSEGVYDVHPAEFERLVHETVQRSLSLQVP